ncbi:hypothetical protein BU17DRAFT_73042 [Hysterangium stoloniferum]|nr:hypothetical protein BU17DRAFT_73042 [Hysterangium stoloniferum]
MVSITDRQSMVYILPPAFRLSASRNLPYYFNTETRDSRWDPPPGLSESELQELPGADQYLNAHGGGAQAPSDGVRASHLLIKHRDSRRPSSWKESNITRSEDEAVDILRGFETQLKEDPTKFAALAKEHSDCSSHEKGGDLGFFGRGQMQESFEVATYALKVGEMSDVIRTASGVHLILRTA